VEVQLVTSAERGQVESRMEGSVRTSSERRSRKKERLALGNEKKYSSGEHAGGHAERTSLNISAIPLNFR